MASHSEQLQKIRRRELILHYMQKIIPHLWFDKEAKEASEFYVSVFPNSRISQIRTITGTPSGDCDIVSFELMGYSLMSISAGPYFKINPSISFMVNFDPAQDPEAEARIDEVWNKLSEGGKVFMEIGEYPYSKRYGWIQDKYGVSWQLILTNPKGELRPAIMPSLLFTRDRFGKAEEAMEFYMDIFEDSKRGSITKHPADAEADIRGTVMFSDFTLNGQWFVAMDGPGTHEFTFNEAISFIVHCETQEEIDYFWEKLSAVPEAEQCGWLKDKYGVSWQIVPTIMDEMMASDDKQKAERVTQAFLKMKKFNLAELKEAYEKES